MEMCATADGEVVVPARLRDQLGIRPGDALVATIEGGRIVIAQPVKRNYGARIITDLRTGLPTATLGEGAPEVTSEMVAEILADFP